MEHDEPGQEAREGNGNTGAPQGGVGSAKRPRQCAHGHRIERRECNAALPVSRVVVSAFGDIEVPPGVPRREGLCELRAFERQVERSGAGAGIQQVDEKAHRGDAKARDDKRKGDVEDRGGMRTTTAASCRSSVRQDCRKRISNGTNRIATRIGTRNQSTRNGFAAWLMVRNPRSMTEHTG